VKREERADCCARRYLGFDHPEAPPETDVAQAVELAMSFRPANVHVGEISIEWQPAAASGEGNVSVRFGKARRAFSAAWPPANEDRFVQDLIGFVVRRAWQEPL
jgi:hypothetical protein